MMSLPVGYGGSHRCNPWRSIRSTEQYIPFQSLNNDATCFNFGKVLKLSRMINGLTPSECASWILNQYIPIMNNKKNQTNKDKRCNLSIQTIMFHFLSCYHSKKRNCITNDEFNKLVCFDATLTSGSIHDYDECKFKLVNQDDAHGAANVNFATTKCTINGKCSFYSLPESVICQNICPFLHLKEIVSTFSKVCLLFAICSENGCVVKNLTIEAIKGKNGNIKCENIRNHWYKCCKIEKLQLLGAPFYDHHSNSSVYSNNIHRLKEYKFLNDILRRYQFSNLTSLTC